MALWGGRFAKDTDARVAQYSASVHYDQRLSACDIRGSLAHVKMLAATGIIPQADAEAISDQLKTVKAKVDAGDFQFKQELEDVHMNIESAIIEALGDSGARLHSGRSRNDQIVTDERLFLRDEADAVVERLTALQSALVHLASANPEAILPGFTHLQHAQPVLFAHHLLAYVEMAERDKCRLLDCRRRLNVCPLGAGALAGSTLPLNREMVAEELGFDGVTQNSMDSVADRDYIIEFVAALSIIAMHASRLSEDLILWMTPEFGFIDLDDAFCTGSSLMPQKKNPDVAELTRGKTGRVYAALVGILTVMKGLPLTYNRDLQEDKEGLFDALDTIKLMLETLAPMLATAEIRADAMEKAASDPALMATDLAEWLVKQGVPFREAHHQVGRFVAYCRDNNIGLDESTVEQMRETIPLANDECLELFSASRSVAARNITGGTAPEQVKRQLARWQEILGSDINSSSAW